MITAISNIIACKQNTVVTLSALIKFREDLFNFFIYSIVHTLEKQYED